MSVVIKKELFDQSKLKRLIFPLMIEQFLSVMIGITDTIMVASISESAVSGVALVESINVLLIQIFSALATGGAVVVAQAIGHQNHEKASQSAKQLVYIVTLISSVLMVICLIWSRQILWGVFGQVDAQVMNDADIFFRLSALSFPFLALYNAGAALFRAMGNSKVSMKTAFIMNLVNIIGNVTFIFGFNMGVEGSALSTLISRVFSAWVMIALLLRSDGAVQIKNFLKIHFNKQLIKEILGIGIPNGLENGMFQVGKLLVQRLITGLGIVAISANAIANSVSTFISIPSGAISLAIITVAGQCVGAKAYRQAIRYTRQLMKISYIAIIAINIVVYLLASNIADVYNLSAQTHTLAVTMIRWYCVVSSLIWVPAFNLPNALRAANDAKFTMVVSVASMWFFRIVLSYVFVLVLNVGPMGIWWAMYIDWVVRALIFELRYRRERWIPQTELG